jgi:hypothetical protein
MHESVNQRRRVKDEGPLVRKLLLGGKNGLYAFDGTL